ncbi:MAG: AraC family transcriptional regulator [Dorea sp.]
MRKKYIPGLFGILDTDNLKDRNAWINGGGIECRHNVKYYYDNSKRPGFNGYMLQYSLNGAGKFVKNGVCHDIKENMGFFVQLPEESIYYLPEDAKEPWTFIFLHFDGNALRPYMNRLEELTGGVFTLPPSAQSIRSLLQLQDRMYNGEKLKKFENSEFIFHFLCTLLRDIENAKEENDNTLIKKSLHLMEQNHRDLESIQDIADSLSISQEHFCRLFKNEMKISPGQYLSQLKIQSAMHDLLNTDDTLEVIAHRNGFSNANYFGKVFKKKVGVTPIQYRNME